MSAAAATAAATAAAKAVVPSDKIMQHAVRLAMEQDKPILLDYYTPSQNGSAFIGVDKETNEKMLVKSADEFTSPIQKQLKLGADQIIITENSIYIVALAIPSKVVTM